VLISNQVLNQQFLARFDDCLFADPQMASKGLIAIERQTVLVADGGEKEIQEDGVARQPLGVLPQEAAVHPREACPRWMANAIRNQQPLLDHLAILLQIGTT
jgi:hypothetical protein